MILKLGMEHQGPEVYLVYINDYPWLTFTNITAMSHWQNLLYMPF